MVFKGASSDPYLFKGLSEKQRAAILANANTRMFLSPGGQMIYGTSVEVVTHRERFIRQTGCQKQKRPHQGPEAPQETSSCVGDSEIAPDAQPSDLH